ncbi:MAG: hypothetical protein NTU95_01255 [Methanothrix sp.]|nr:hypothetical protein [Methanothrix sp.]
MEKMTNKEKIKDANDRFVQARNNLKEMQKTIAPFVKQKPPEKPPEKSSWCDAAELFC